MAKVAPAGQAVSADILDFNERDPKTIHDPAHFQVAWEEVFAEPDPGVHSFQGVWRASYLVFSYSRLWSYRLCSIFGVIQALCYGLEFGCTSCYMIWCCIPCLKHLTICCLPLRKCLFIILDVCIAPIIHAVSKLFWNIRIVMAKGDGGTTQNV